MTSTLSSAKQFRTSFLQTLKKSWFYPVAVFLLLLPSFNDLFYMYRERSYFLSGLSDYDYTASYIFALQRHAGNDEVAYCCLVVGLAGMFTALHIWRFLHVKKTVNVFASLGLTRANLFFSRFLAGVVLLCMPVVLIFAGLFLGNLMLFGSSPELWTATAVYTLTFIVVSLFSYSVTSLCMVISGASIESFLCSGCLIAMPVTVFYGCKYLAMAFLKGAPYDHRMYDVFTNDRINSGDFGGRLDVLDFFYPVNDYTFSDGFMFDRELGWSQPRVSYALVYLALAAVVTAVAFVCFKKRRNENAGFLGTRPSMVASACLSLAFLLVLPLYIADIDLRSVKIAAVCIAALILFFVFVIIMAILLRSRQKMNRAMPAILVACAVFGLVSAFFITGAFGYETRIPDKEDIASVSITSGAFVPNKDYNSFNRSYYTQWYADDDTRLNDSTWFALDQLQYYYSSSDSCVTDLTDEQSIDTVLTAHRLLSEAKEEDTALLGFSVALQYTLKDGTQLTRYYEHATPQVVELLSVFEEHQSVRDSAVKIIEEQWIDTISLFAPAASQITLIPQPMMAEGFGEELLNALISDTKDKTLPLTRYGTTAPLGYLSLSSSLFLYDEEYYYGDGDYYAEDYYVDYGVSYYYEDIAYATTAVPHSMVSATMFDEITTLTVGQLENEYSEFNAYQLYPVYADMKATVALLTEYDLLQYFDVVNVPVRAKVMEFPLDMTSTRADANNKGYYTYRSIYFNASYTPADEPSFVNICPDGAITNDAAVLAQLVKDSFFMHEVNEGSYLVAFEYADGTSVQTYVPAESIPENLR